VLTSRANIHRHRLPAPGAVVTVRTRRPLPGHRYRRFIVESFPLSDAADQRYSRGIHTVTLRALDNSERVRVAGHWCGDEWGEDL
jgi:hypothetical protein